uniref:Uncharacterized protein n=1 Tax=Panagrolaimus sp. JU765 TaxID=591449 RepID=A0AC34QUB3_9BILA
MDEKCRAVAFRNFYGFFGPILPFFPSFLPSLKSFLSKSEVSLNLATFGSRTDSSDAYFAWITMTDNV